MKIIIEGVARNLDGTYDFELERVTNREWHLIKEISGVRVGELEKALGAFDNDLLVAFAAIALQRAGRRFIVDQLWDADSGTITIDVTDEETGGEEDLPPQSVPNSPSEPSGSGASSSTPSTAGSESQETTPAHTGERTSDTSAT